MARATYHCLAGEDPGPDVRAAEAAYRKAIELLPGLAPPWWNLAHAHSTLAAFELEQGRDPQRSLDQAEEALRSAFKRNPSDAQVWQNQGETRGLRARWRALQHQARAEDFEEAARSFEKALELEPRNLGFRVAFGQFCREWALWRKEAGLDPHPSLNRGLALADEALAARPTWADALLLRASLRWAAAEPGLPPEQQRESQRQAQEDLDRALALNPHLMLEWKRQLAQRPTAAP